MFEIITIEELLKRLDNYNHKELHIHHTWKPSHKDFNGSNGLQLQKGMRDYHVNNLGWSDIGQHVTLLPNGLFVTGRDFSQTPASISGYNTGAFACETLGDFDIGHDVLEGEQKDSLLRLSKYFDDKKRYCRFHRENANKTCPGTSIDKNVFMNEVRNYGQHPISQPVEQPKPQPQINQEVLKQQQIINRLLKLGIAEDGIWGNQSKNATIKLQQILGISADGIWGDQTWRSVNLILAKTSCSIKNKPHQIVTRYIQYRVGTSYDGIWGNGTVAKVKEWQKLHGLSPDGIVGNNSWNALIG